MSTMGATAGLARRRRATTEVHETSTVSRVSSGITLCESCFVVWRTCAVYALPRTVRITHTLPLASIHIPYHKVKWSTPRPAPARARPGGERRVSSRLYSLITLL